MIPGLRESLLQARNLGLDNALMQLQRLYHLLSIHGLCFNLLGHDPNLLVDQIQLLKRPPRQQIHVQSLPLINVSDKAALESSYVQLHVMDGQTGVILVLHRDLIGDFGVFRYDRMKVFRARLCLLEAAQEISFIHRPLTLEWHPGLGIRGNVQLGRTNF